MFCDSLLTGWIDITGNSHPSIDSTYQPVVSVALRDIVTPNPPPMLILHQSEYFKCDIIFDDPLIGLFMQYTNLPQLADNFHHNTPPELSGH